MTELVTTKMDMLSQQGVTSLGLDESKSFSDEELDSIASQCGAVGTALDWILGDLYIRKCAKLGIIIGRPEIKSPSAGRLNDIDNWCKSKGIVRHSAENKASICRAYPRSERVQGLSLTHHSVVQGIKGERRRQLLLSAQKGDPPYNLDAPEFDNVWSSRRLIEEKKILEGKAATPAARLVNPPEKKEEALTTFRAQLIEKKIPKKVINIAATAVKRASDKLDNEFSKSVTRETSNLVEIAIRKEKDRLNKFSDELDEQEKLLKMRGKQVSGLMSKLEYKKIISCLHPDKQPEERRKAYQEATQIFLRLKGTVQPDAEWKA